MSPEEIADAGICLRTQEDWDAIEGARMHLLMRFVGEIVRRMPETEREALVSALQGHFSASDEAQNDPLSSEDKEYERIWFAQEVAARELIDIITHPRSALNQPNREPRKIWRGVGTRSSNLR